MQARDVTFEIQLSEGELPHTLSDLYFHRNPMHWRLSSDTNENPTETFSVNDQFTRIKVGLNTDTNTYSGGLYGGIGVTPEQIFSAKIAEKTFTRLKNQQRMWKKYFSKEKYDKDSPWQQQDIDELINLRAPTDWILTVTKSDSRLNQPKLMTLSAGQAGTRAVFTKLCAVGGQGQNIYTGTFYGTEASTLKPEVAERYFEEILKRGNKALELELNHILKHDIFSIITQIPKESWKVSNRPQSLDDGSPSIGYFISSSGLLKEGHHSFYFKIEVSVDTLDNEQRIRVYLERNGYKVMEPIDRESQKEILDFLCKTLRLKSFHTGLSLSKQS